MSAEGAFSRVDFSGVGLFRSTLVTHSRCHQVAFNLTANNPERLAALVLTLERIGAARAETAQPPDPPCRKGHAGAHNLLSKSTRRRADRPSRRSRCASSSAMTAG